MSTAADDTTPTYYDVLGVPHDAQLPEIKSAYRRLMRIYHPDVYGPAGEEISRDIGGAYTVLSDPEARDRYDRELAGIDEEPLPHDADEDVVFEDVWGEEDQWEVPADEQPAPRPGGEPQWEDDPRLVPEPPAPSGGGATKDPAPTGATPGKREAGAVRETTWPLSAYPDPVLRSPSRGLWVWLLVYAALIAAAIAWSFAVGSGDASVNPHRGLMGVAIALGAAVGVVLSRPSKRTKTQQIRNGPKPPPRRTILVVTLLLAALVVGLTPPTLGVLSPALLAAVAAAGAVVLLMRVMASQKHLDQYLARSTLKQFNVFGTVQGGVTADLVRREVTQLHDIPQLRLFCESSARAPFSFAAVVGDRVALIQGLMVTPGEFRWSGPSLLRQEAGQPYPQEVLSNDYAAALKSFRETLGPKVTVASWVFVYTAPAGGQVTAHQDDDHPRVIAAKAGIQEVGDFFMAGDRREDVDQQVVVDALKAMSRVSG